jgi:coproporphyrinogen III oxidase-like Fe-S oxidoreductase
VLSPDQIKGIIAPFRSRFETDFEFTLEANPEDITKEWVEWVLQLGVNRISLGVQSLRDKTLKKIGRGSSQGIFSALEILQKSHIRAVNVDWIIGLPYGEEGDVFQDMKYICSRFSCVKHTSIYFLEKGEYPKDWMGICMQDEEQKAEYARMRAYLLEIGWNHYEISNFSAPWFACKHNRSYWNHSFVRWFGLSAASYIPRGYLNDTKTGIEVSGIQGERFENAATFTGYYRGDIIHKEAIVRSSYLLEEGMFWLRTFALPFSSLFPHLPEEEKYQKLHTYIQDGLIEFTEETHTLRPTIQGIFLIDYLLQELL